MKALKRIEQNDLCATCSHPLPPSYNVLDRITAIGGYTIENTRLVCETCDRATQMDRRYR